VYFFPKITISPPNKSISNLERKLKGITRIESNPEENQLVLIAPVLSA
jgi:hypothetical protein